MASLQGGDAGRGLGPDQAPLPLSMKRALILGLIICLGLPVAARGQEAEKYMGQQILEKQGPASAAERGPMEVPYPPNPYPATPEGPPMFEGELPAYQAHLKEFLEEERPKEDVKKKTMEPTHPKSKEVR